MRNNNTIQVVSLIIKELKIPVSSRSISDELQKHPDFPSLLAINEVLNNWNIPNAPYQLTFEELAAAKVPVPFIAYFPNGEFVVVNKLTTDHALVSNQRWNRHRLNIDEFKGRYQRTILALEKDELSGEADYHAKLRSQRVSSLRIPFVIAGLVALLITYSLLNPNSVAGFKWITGLLLLFKAAGLTTAILLLMQSIDSNNPLIQRLCGGDENKNCNAILASNAAKVIKELSWSEVGFFYYAGTLLALCFNAGNNNMLHLLAILNVISLPYTFYSIYYQWRIAKQWCIFCCTVQGLLWLEFFAFLPYFNFNHLPAINEFGNLLIAMAIPVLVWAFIKPYLIKAIQLPTVQQQLYMLKYNKDLFNKMLNSEVKYVLPPADSSIIFGDSSADNIITMVSNPYCTPCSKAHKILDDLLTSRDDIRLQLVFNIPRYDSKGGVKVADHFMSLKQTRDNASLRQALNDWYGQKKKDHATWAKHYPVDQLMANQEAIIKQSQWCQMTEITGTPTIFINGQRLPKAYQPEDLKYIL